MCLIVETVGGHRGREVFSNYELTKIWKLVQIVCTFLEKY